uniref:Uncharacterized protein n=1 Tax=Oryza rufipogon TaxID=4529 RepID=A0A0E0MR35_ORYRU
MVSTTLAIHSVSQCPKGNLVFGPVITGYPRPMGPYHVMLLFGASTLSLSLSLHSPRAAATAPAAGRRRDGSAVVVRQPAGPILSGFQRYAIGVRGGNWSSQPHWGGGDAVVPWARELPWPAGRGNWTSIGIHPGRQAGVNAYTFHERKPEPEGKLTTEDGES